MYYSFLHRINASIMHCLLLHPVFNALIMHCGLAMNALCLVLIAYNALTTTLFCPSSYRFSTYSAVHAAGDHFRAQGGLGEDGYMEGDRQRAGPAHSQRLRGGKGLEDGD